MTTLYYHNPRCSKSRQGLELIQSKGLEAPVKLYLKEKMTQKEILELINLLEISPLEGLVRTKEAAFKELGLKGKELSNKEWSKLIVENPTLLERPILIHNNKAKIGRPPEDLLEII